MNWIKAIANDLLNGFSADDIPVFLARIFVAAVLAFVLKIIFKLKHKDSGSIMSYIVPLSMAIAVVVPVAQFSISLGLILAAIVVGMFINLKPKTNVELIYATLVLLSASALGAGYVVYTLVGMVLVFVYLIVSKH